MPIDESVCFSTVGMTAAQEVTDAIAEALEQQSIQLEQYYASWAMGSRRSRWCTFRMCGPPTPRSWFARRYGP